MLPEYSIGVVTYNSSHHVERLLASTHNITPQPAEIIILDNASTDGHWPRLQARLQEDGYVVGSSSRNSGFGAAVNQVLTKAVTDLVWVLNPDCVITTRDVSPLLRECSALDTIASPLLTTDEGERIWWAGGGIRMDRFSVWHEDARTPRGAEDTQFVSGAAFMLPRAAVLRLGGLRDDLFLYWEDLELSIRAARSGLRLRVVPDVLVDHVVGGSRQRKGKSPEFYYYFSRNRIAVARSLGFSRSSLTLGPPAIGTVKLLGNALGNESHKLNSGFAVVHGTLRGLTAWTGESTRTSHARGSHRGAADV